MQKFKFTSSRSLKVFLSGISLLSSLFVFAGCGSSGDDVISYLNDLFNNKDSDYCAKHKELRKNVLSQIDSLRPPKSQLPPVSTPWYFNNFFSLYNKPPTQNYPSDKDGSINPFLSKTDESHPDAWKYSSFNDSINPYQAMVGDLDTLISNSATPPLYSIQPYFEIATDFSNISEINKGGEVKIHNDKTYLVSFQAGFVGAFQYPMLCFNINLSQPLEKQVTVSLPGPLDEQKIPPKQEPTNFFNKENGIFSSSSDQYNFWIDLANNNVSNKKAYKNEQPVKNFNPSYLSFEGSGQNPVLPPFPYFLTTSKDFQLSTDKNAKKKDTGMYGYYISRGSFWMLGIFNPKALNPPESLYGDKFCLINFSNFKYDSNKHKYTSIDIYLTGFNKGQQIFGG